MMTTKHSATIVISLLLAACAHAPQQAGEAPAEAGETAKAAAATPGPQAKKPDYPKLELTGQMLYEFLLGEVANQRGRGDLAVRTYIKLAGATRDPRVAARAAGMAYESRDMAAAAEAFSLWLELEPASFQAKQMLSIMLLRGGRLEEARPHLAGMLAAYPDSVGHAFMKIYPFLLRHPDKMEVFDLLRDLTQPYPRVAEAHWVLAQAAEAAGKHDLALDEARQARALRPELEAAALLEAQLLRRASPQQALEMLKKYVSAYPQASEARLFYARILLEQKRYAESRREFRYLLEVHPENADLAFAVAMLSLEMGELEQAENQLHLALDKGKRDEHTVYYYLGQLSEARKDDEKALEHYLKVRDGEHAHAARLRMAFLAAKTGKIEEAREYLRQTVTQNNQQRVQLLLTEAQLLREAKQIEEAYRVLTQGLEKLPGHPNLLYVAAMLADQLGKHEAFEQMMRKVIQVKPDHAQAYNALGYSLLDRNERIEEGMQLVEKASQLAPDDSAVIDSVGWGHYRLGNLSKSLEFLRRAYSANPDPEIAAHLGEVLWAHGDKEQARKIWDDSLKLHPDNAVLQAVMKKFLP
ncbi:MAG: tetratricopeptide repeat protein [Nitrosomonadales bacterium]|nr:tetratricopeptide repeat protein [Nitrosomonadales bacterium]